MTLHGNTEPGQITRLLHLHRAGSRDAFDELVGLVYHHLRLLARRQVARGWGSRTLDTTTLVHEAYLQLVHETDVDWNDRQHFFAIASSAMRRILVDYARYRGARKRGGGQPPLDLEEVPQAVGAQLELVLAVDAALTELETFNERLSQVVECRYFAGLTEEETATALGVSLRTVQRDWARARAWLTRELA